MQLDEPFESASAGDPLLLYIILHLLFFPLVWIVCALGIESRKKYQHGLDAGPLEFQFLRQKGYLTNTFRILLICFGVMGKTPGFICCKNVVKNYICIGHHDNILPRCDSIFSLLRCQGMWNKTCTQLSLSQTLFQNPNNYNLGDVQRFCYHSWWDSAVIFDQISNSSNVYLSLSRFWTATSLVILYQLPSVSKSKIPPRNFWSGQISFPWAFFTNTSVSVADRPVWNKILWQISVHFLHAWRIKKNDFTRQVL